MSAFGVPHDSEEFTKANYQVFSGVNFANKGTLVRVMGGPGAKKKHLKTPYFMARRGTATETQLRSVKASNKKSVEL